MCRRVPKRLGTDLPKALRTSHLQGPSYPNSNPNCVNPERASNCLFLCGVGKHWVYRLNISQTLTPEEGIAYACPSMGTDSFPTAR